MNTELLLMLPNNHAIFVMVLIVIALFLFAYEKLPLATSSLLVLVCLSLVFTVFPYQTSEGVLTATDFFSGFGHQALVTISALMIAGNGLVRTGALESIGHYLALHWVDHPKTSLFYTLFVGAVLSAFVNNTPIVILLLPLLVSVSLKTSTKSSDILMPMGFATLIGGMSTTIGTSTNLLVVAVAQDLGLKQFEMFDFLLPAAIAGSVGLLYLWLIAPYLMPEREPRLKTTSPRLFSAQLHINEDSVANGLKLSEVIDKTVGQLTVLQIIRGKDGSTLFPLPDVVLREGDSIVARDTSAHLKEFEKILATPLFEGGQAISDDHPLQDSHQQTAEVVVITGSTLDGMTLNNARFTDRYQLMVLALHRRDKWRPSSTSKPSGDVVLRSGDVILVQGSKDKIKRLKASRNLMVLDERSDLPHSAKATVALSIMAFIILTAAFGVLPIVMSSLTGVLLMLLTGCLQWKDATRALSAPVILIVVTSLAMGLALVKTGGADYLAWSYVQITEGYTPAMIISGLLLVMAVLTNVVSNNAAAVIGTPIAISIAMQLGLPAEPFVLAVLFGANMSFATPMAYQTNLLVMNAGNYRFSDFMRIGIPLTLILWVLLSFLLPWFYLE